MVIGLAILIWLGLAPHASAHGIDLPQEGLLAYSTWDPLVIDPLLVSAALYASGLSRLWHEAGPGRGIRYWQPLCFAAGWLMLVLALVSPLHWLGERLLSAHMIEHELLMAVAAPLLAAARPIGAFLWALPIAARRALGAAARHGAVARLWTVITTPLVATVSHGIAIWLWHVPVLFDAAVADATLHRLQHASFLGTALLFWWAILRRRTGYGTGTAHVFITMLHTGLLGALMTLSPRLWYAAQSGQAAAFGLEPLEDQQLAGLIMWIPAGVVYAGAGLALAALWIAHSGAGVSSGGAARAVPEGGHALAR